jgi:predicted transcriptional regulator
MKEISRDDIISLSDITINHVDLKLINLLVLAYSNKQITEKKIPISTVQKRIKKIIENGFVDKKEAIYKKLGLKSGLIYIYVANDIIYSIVEKLLMNKCYQFTTYK